MRKILLIPLFALALFLFGGLVVAQEDSTSAAYEDIGETLLAPDSPFYFLRNWQERIERLFARSDEARADLELRHAQRRVGEMRRLARLGRDNLLERVRERWQAHLERAQERAERVGERREEVRQRVLEATDRHRTVLERVREEAPERAREALDRAIENSRVQRERLLERFSPDQRRELEKRLRERVEDSIDRFELPRERLQDLLKEGSEEVSPLREGR